MNKISFILKDPKSDKDTAIILLYTCSDGRLKYYTGQSAHKDNWPNVDRGTKAILKRIETAIEHLHTDYKIKGDPLTKEVVRLKLDKILHRNKQKLDSDMFSDMERIIDRMEDGKILTPGKKKYSAGSIKTFRFTVELLRRFDPKLKLSAVNMTTYHRFINYCQGLDYSTNYIGSQIKNWKSLCRLIGGNPVFESREFKKMSEDSFNVYLNETELAAIFNLSLSKRQAVVRDWFILDCYTGLRVSDLVILSKKNYSNGFITIANKKTDEKVVIPVHPMVRQIMDRRKGFPPRVTDVEINREIKKIAEKAEINEDVLFTITKGGRRQDTYLKKWEMVSAHTSRRSFITNLLKRGAPETLVMKLTGIKSSATIRRYNKISTEEAAKIMQQHDFFK